MPPPPSFPVTNEQAIMPPPTKAPGVRQFFGRNGALSKWHPNYEFRPGQLEMAEAVESALNEKRHLIVEAGTGTGKTLAYLLPALLSNRRVVVSTGTKNLQEQLFYKDVPFLKTVLEQAGMKDIRVCYMKGRANYLCRQKLYDLEAHPGLAVFEEPERLKVLHDWEKTTVTGDRAELTALPESGDGRGLWERLDARRETCSGQKCAQYDRCFITEMHRRAVEADLVIVNHHLFFADLSLKRLGIPGMGVLPDYGAVIFDEAHEVEDVAGQYFGVSVSNYRLEDLARDCQYIFMKGGGTPALHAAVRSLERQSEGFFAALPVTEV